MARNLVPRYHVALDITTLDDPEAELLVSGIQLAAATSALILNNPGIQACIAALGNRRSALIDANQVVADDRSKLHLDLAALAEVRAALNGELRTFVTLLQNTARSPADIQGAGLAARIPVARRQPPDAPLGVDQRPPSRGHGRITVIAQEAGPGRRYYMAEQSADGLTWTPLGVGRGKMRVLRGTSGAQIWVRFAAVRGELVSPWCTPALVTIP
jgi:hypothetical protein